MILDFLKSLGTMILIIIPILCLIFALVFIPDIIIEKIDNKKRQKQEEEYKKQGIEKRWAEMGCGFYICKVHNDEVFYLNQNGEFYNTTTNVKAYNFDTDEELDNYIEDNRENIKSSYGEVMFKKYRRRVYLGYCKQI